MGSEGGGVKLYGAAKAACPQRVMACFLELDLQFHLVHVDLDLFHHKSPHFLALQPFGQVPVMEDGDFRLYESRAIIRYLAAKHANRNPNLGGESLEEKAIVDQWLEVEAHNFNELVKVIVLNVVIFPRIGQTSDQAVVDASSGELEKVLDVYEQRLGVSKYLAGNEYTLADLSHLPGLRYLVDDARMGHLIANRKHVNEWWNSISARPAWKKVLQLAAY